VIFALGVFAGIFVGGVIFALGVLCQASAAGDRMTESRAICPTPNRKEAR
jgi:hypothetical protein